jgi:hypothetical protein
MKLFVWEDVLCDYTCGQMVALATTIEEARKILLQKCSYIPEKELNKQPKEYDLSSSVGFVIWGGG